MPPAGAGVIPEVVVVARTKENALVEGLIQMLAREAFKGAARQKAMQELGPENQDQAKIADLVAKALESYRLEGVEYKDGKLFVMPAEKGSPVSICALLLPDRVVFASSAVAAKRAATKPAAALADKREFRDALTALPSGAVAVQYLDAARAFNLGYGTAVPFLANWGRAPRLKERWGLDFANLPPAEQVSAHLAPEAGAFYADERGLRLEGRGNLPRAALVALVGAIAHRAGAGGGPGPGQPGGRRPQPQPQPLPMPEREEF
jgi:hypothetical protein